jgi:CHAD domain-containing protein
MRRVTKALGAARDTDVQMDFLEKFLDGLTETRYHQGIKRLLLRRQQEREGLQGRVIKEMDRLESSGVLEKMEGTLRQIYGEARLRGADTSSPYVYQQAYLQISSRLEKMLSYERYVSQPERIEELHLMRIAVKRLRYTMEVFEPLYKGDLKQPLKTVRQVQTILGDIHDCDVWVQYLPEFLGEERIRALEYLGHTKSHNRLKQGILYLQQERQQHRTELHKEFVESWKQLQDQNFWDNLLERISQPQPSESLNLSDSQLNSEKEENP